LAGGGARPLGKSTGKGVTMDRPASIRVFSWFFWFLEVYIWLIIIRIMVSWIIPNHYNSMLSLTFELTDPLLNFLKKVIPSLKFCGAYYTDMTVVLVLFAILVLRHFYRAFSCGSPDA
jgi:YggT family protein